MSFDNYIPKADGFRFINHLHTTARQLEICSQIIIELNGGQKLHQSLFNTLTRWSLELEHSDLRYAESKGKLTTKGKPTTAFNHYLELCKSLNLITEFNKIYANSRLAYILLYFEIQRHKKSIGALSEYE